MASRTPKADPDLGSDFREGGIDPRMIPVFVEDYATMFLVGTIFVDLFHAGRISIFAKQEFSVLISRARSVLYDSLARAVVVVMNAKTADVREAAELRGTLQRLLVKASPDGWHAAVAVPDVAAWVRTDPRYRKMLSRKGEPLERAKACFEFAKAHGFDRGPLREEVEEFGELEEFLLRYARVLATAATTRP